MNMNNKTTGPSYYCQQVIVWTLVLQNINENDIYQILYFTLNVGYLFS